MTSDTKISSLYNDDIAERHPAVQTKIDEKNTVGVMVQFNPFKPSGAKWLHYKVFKAILV